MAGSTLNNLKSLVYLFEEYNTLLNRTKKFNFLITLFCDDNSNKLDQEGFKEFLENNILSGDNDESDAVDFPIFLRWLSGEFHEQDFLSRHGAQL